MFAKNEIRNAKGELIRIASVVPSDKVNVAFCGIGHRGGRDLKSFNETRFVNTTVLCDVDLGASHTTENIKAHPKAKKMELKLPNVPESPSNHYENFVKAVKGEEKQIHPLKCQAI